MSTLSKNELLTRIAAIIGTLGETKGSPESMLYMFLDMDMDNWTMVRSILLDAEMVTIKGNYVTLTDKGMITADRINGIGQ